MERIKAVIVSDGSSVAVMLNDSDISDNIDDIAFRAIPGSDAVLDIGKLEMHRTGSREDFFRRAGEILGYEVAVKK